MRLVYIHGDALDASLYMHVITCLNFPEISSSTSLTTKKRGPTTPEIINKREPTTADTLYRYSIAIYSREFLLEYYELALENAK